MYVVQALAASLAGVTLRYHLPPSSVAEAPGSNDIGEAVSSVGEAVRHGLSVRGALELLAERCEKDEGWRTKATPSRRRGWRAWVPSDL